ncbi:hypothetical protein H8S95_15565 [Pontibacter sp. KCTC 32443]|uniref:hypothetical protein n=1 Tax=Pontibacter TaxID=323449 RepID=UPI00164E6D03|nr:MULTISPECIES: hypothetical protein [Pontibacter]MBC5775495.1 hypothetical protein [Pontibacter sp. KCTC 32443]
MSLDLKIAFAMSELGLVYLLAFYVYRFATGKVHIRDDKKHLYELWVSRNGNSVKRGIIVLTVLFSAAILSQLL